MKTILTHRVNRKLAFLLFFTGLASVGMFLINYAMHWGPWTIVDTVDYFDSANNLIAGRGLAVSRASGTYQPMYLHPMLYSFVLAGAKAAGMNLVDAARYVNLVSFFILTITLGYGTYLLSNSILAGVFISIVLATLKALVYNFTGAATESIYFTLSFLSFFLISLFVQSTKKYWLVLSATMAGLSLFTRYYGFATISVGIIAILLWEKTELQKRIISSLLFLSISLLPYGLWRLDLALRFPAAEPIQLTTSFGNLWYETIPPRLAIVKFLWQSFGFFPTNSYNTQLLSLAMVVFLFTILGSISIYYRSKSGRAWWNDSLFISAGIYFLYTFFSAGVLLLSFAIIRIPKPDLFERHISPLPIGLIAALAFLVLFIVNTWRSKLIQGSLLIIFLGWIMITNIPQLKTYITNMHTNGDGYTSRQWRNSPVMKEIISLENGETIVTNDPAAILFFTGKPAYDLINEMSKIDVKAREIPDVIEKPGTFIVLFNPSYSFQLRNLIGEDADVYDDIFHNSFNIVFDSPDGTIYQVP